MHNCSAEKVGSPLNISDKQKAYLARGTWRPYKRFLFVSGIIILSIKNLFEYKYIHYELMSNFLNFFNGGNTCFSF